VDTIKGVIGSPWFLIYVYWFGWPAISAKIWPAFIGPMPEPDPFTVFTLLYMALKGVCYCGMMFVALLLYIYFKQEGLLYVPA
jgi:hypothetical protein